jgi:hypothetical protein
MSNELEQMKKEIDEIAQALKKLKFCIDELEKAVWRSNWRRLHGIDEWEKAPAQAAGGTVGEQAPITPASKTASAPAPIQPR